MIDEGDKEKIDEQFSMLDARAKKQRRRSIVMTILLAIVTGALVMRLANDIVDKAAQVRRSEASRGQLDQQLRSEQEKLDSAVKTREKLEAEIKELEATKKSYQNRILSEKDAHNFGEAQTIANGKYPVATAPMAESQAFVDVGDVVPTASASAPGDAPPLLIEESGKAPEGFSVQPNIKINPALGLSGRGIFKVQVWLDIPEAKRANVESVTYHLSSKYYLKNTIEGGSVAPFEAKFNVFACESTVLARIRLRDTTTLAVDFDWCRAEGWPARKKELVIVTSEDEKTPSTLSSTPIPNTAPPLNSGSNPGITILPGRNP